MAPLTWVALSALLAGCNTPECGHLEEDIPLIGSDLLYNDYALPRFDLAMDAATIEGLPDDPEDPRGPDSLASLTFGAFSYDVGLKLKGTSTFRNISQKPSFKIDMTEWDDDQRLFGIKRLTLNSMVVNTSMLSESLSYKLFELMGVTAPRHGYACVSVNSEPYGLYSVIETMDEQFIDANFEDGSGNLYEGDYTADLGGDHPEGFQFEEEGEPADKSDLWGLSAQVDAAKPADWLALLEANFDVDDLLATWAVDVVLSNPDAYPTSGNNFLLYHEPNILRWTMIPWGTDQAMQAEIDPYNLPGSGGRLFRGCLNSAPCKSAFEAKVVEVGEEMHNQDFAGWAEGQLDLIKGVSRDDPKSEFSGWQTCVAQVGVMNYVQTTSSIEND